MPALGAATHFPSSGRTINPTTSNAANMAVAVSRHAFAAGIFPIDFADSI
jgi:hypothetical protein